MSVVIQNINPVDGQPTNHVSSSKSMVQLLHSFLADYRVVAGAHAIHLVMPSDAEPLPEAHEAQVCLTHYLVHRDQDVVSGYTVVLPDSPPLLGAFLDFTGQIRNLALHPANVTSSYGWVAANFTSKFFADNLLAIASGSDNVEHRRLYALSSVYQFFLACLVIDSRNSDIAYAAISEQFAASLAKLGFAPVKLGSNLAGNVAHETPVAPYVLSLSPFRDESHPLQGLFNGIRSITGVSVHSF